MAPSLAASRLFLPFLEELAPLSAAHTLQLGRWNLAVGGPPSLRLALRLALVLDPLSKALCVESPLWGAGVVGADGDAGHPTPAAALHECPCDADSVAPAAVGILRWRVTQ